ncbi:hypothetical protein ABBQ32_013992 [Trebouxia sp. C0010 RCD-2024]
MRHSRQASQRRAAVFYIQQADKRVRCPDVPGKRQSVVRAPSGKVKHQPKVT